MQKNSMHAYLFAFVFRNAERVAFLLYFTHSVSETRPPIGAPISADVSKTIARKHLSRMQRKRALFRFTSDLVAQLCLKRRLAALRSRTGVKSGSLSMPAIRRYGFRISETKRDSSISWHPPKCP